MRDLHRSILLRSVVTLGVVVLTTASSTFLAQNGPPWRIYKPDAKFSEVFGRSITIQSESGGLRGVEDPTLLQALQVKGDHGVNALARESVFALLRSVAAGAPSTCEGLTSVKLPWVRFLSAQDVAASEGAPSNCKVLGVIDKEINFEVLLPPAAQWNGKFLMGATGGFLGNLQNSSKPAALDRGYATASTDTGHVAPEDGGASWAYQNPDRLVNFGHRGTHLAAANAKLVIQAYYQKAIAYSYYVGSSGSGRTAMMEPQRYPQDFDGVVAGCPVHNWTQGLGMGYAWTQQAMYPTAADHYNFTPAFPAEKLPLLDDTVYAKCDAVDGLKDGLIADPRACRFDPVMDLPRCAAGEDKPDCFTRQQAELIGKIHHGPSNSTGQIVPGWTYGGAAIPGAWVPAPGERSRRGYVIGAPMGQAPYSSRHYLLGNETLRYLVFGDPSYDLHSFNFETDVPATQAAAAQIDAVDPDMRAFKARGGKLIMWIGWSDFTHNPLSSVSYYESVVRTMGGRQSVGTFARLFMVPGMGLCSGGDPRRKIPTVADFLTPLEQWVEHGVAPARIIASHIASQKNREVSAPPHGMPILFPVDRTRPLCPYPEVAAYKGAGSIDEAANFVCRDPNP